ncbi:MAG: ATP-binding protein [Bacillota bacterium]
MSKAGVITLYAKELKLSTFTGYQAVIRQATAEGWGYEDFLCAMLSRETANRKGNQITRRVRAARFPLSKTLDEFQFTAYHTSRKPWSGSWPPESLSSAGRIL